MDRKVFSKLSYGMYLVTSEYDGKRNTFVVNTAFQVSSKTPMVAISVSKDVFSHDLIDKSKKFSLSVLRKDASIAFIKELGFFSGKAKDKLVGLKVIDSQDIPVVMDHCCAYLTAKVINKVDCGTHTLFVAEVLDSHVIDDSEILTYAEYKTKKGGTPWTAPTFNIEKMKPQE
jgi:flavin reductase (DIM6/NTAB) family NADH-FMN oxidoreductase RutF